MNIKAVNDILIIARMKTVPDLKRQPLSLMLSIMISAFPLFFFAMASMGEAMKDGLIGAMIAMVSNTSISAAIQDVTQDRYVKIREIMVAKPIHPVSYALGIALGALLLSLPGVVFYFMIAILTGVLEIVSLIWIIPSLLLCWAALSTLGFTISTYLYKSSTYTLSYIATMLSLGLIFFPPVYYPAKGLGKLSWLSYLIPTANAAEIIRGHVDFSELLVESLLIRWSALIVTTVIFTFLTALKAKWRET